MLSVSSCKAAGGTPSLARVPDFPFANFGVGIILVPTLEQRMSRCNDSWHRKAEVPETYTTMIAPIDLAITERQGITPARRHFSNNACHATMRQKSAAFIGQVQLMLCMNLPLAFVSRANH